MEQNTKRVNILGVTVDSVTMAEAVAQVESYIEEKNAPSLVATANAEMIMNAGRDAELMRILNSAQLVVPDGAGTVWAARHLGYEMKERVAGFDMAQELLKDAPQKNYRVYFFGSAPGIAEKAKEKAEKLYPGINVVGVHDGYFDAEEEKKIIADIKEKKPHILFAALGVPKQEKWLFRHKEELGVPVSIGVGGTLDVMAGAVKRAPLWMQKAQLEWLFRGLMQPKRAGRLMALPKFVLKVHLSKK